ncbi:DUF4258 domain-containing protein [uncultured Bilophila sp.]|uniref:DUF4258 domain-containing protein n=2 Tax=uncultured Bilophila sp. TaxID=529385 RepID=UPI00262F4346|nr:DUF4258 domain-containing protein [uncultured Bilophila sp.]
MNLTFSAHALDRCLERGISLQLVADALFSGHLERYGDRYVVRHGRLKVVAERQDDACVIVTAYRDAETNKKRRVRQRRQQVRKFQRASRKESGIWW